MFGFVKSLTHLFGAKAVEAAPPKAALTGFEAELLGKFKRYNLDKNLCALIVILQRRESGENIIVNPKTQKPEWFGHAIIGVPKGVDPYHMMEEYLEAGDHVAMAFDLQSGTPLETQFRDWLPGTIETPAHYIHHPILSLGLPKAPKHSHHVPPLNRPAPQLMTDQDIDPVPRGRTLKGAVAAPSYITGVFRNDKLLLG